MKRFCPQQGSIPLWCLLLCYLGFLWLYLAIDLYRPRISVGDTGLSYRVTIEGITDHGLRKLMEAVSNTIADRKRLPASMSLLRRRADRDVPRLLKALRSHGYYGAKVAAEIDEKADPILVKFLVDHGPAYLLKSVDIHTRDEALATKIKLPEPRQLGLIVGTPAKSKPILDAEKALIGHLRKQGFPFPKVIERKALVDHAAHSMGVRFLLDPGPLGRFGATELTGLESVNEAFLRGKIPWKEGDFFNADLLAEAQKRLTATGLFATVQVKTGEALDEEARLPVTIELKERKHRTIKFGLSYKTDEGPGGKIGWEHRNFFGRGERLSVGVTGSGITYSAEGAFKKPEFLRTDQSLLLNLRLAEDHPDAFTSRNVSSSLLVERALTKGMRLGAGLGYKFSDIDQLGQEERFGLLSIPWKLDWDTSDNLLDPTRGGRLALRAAPFFDTFEADFGFAKGYASYSRYLRLSKRPSLTLAGRAAFGSIWGAERDAVPADERFYAGGGGSIRGLPFQSAGPLRGDDPLGGRSLLEFSLELRAKVSETIGFVTFIDGGSAFSSVLPDFDEELRWGAGMGLRYFTPIGPLRLDVGVPLNPRDDIDDPFQIYVSFGQAF